MSQKAAPRTGDVPYSIDAERSVLGAALLEPECHRKLLRLLNRSDFFIDYHQILFDAFALLASQGKAATHVTVCAALAELGTIDDLDRLAGEATEVFLVYLAEDYLSPLWIDPHAKIIKDYSDRRQAIQQGQQMVKDAYNPASRPQAQRGWVQR